MAQKKKDVTHIIERIEPYEEKAGVKLKALSAFLEYGDDVEDAWSVEVFGELHSMNGESLKGDIALTLGVYDASDRVIATEKENIDSDEFHGFEMFQIEVWDIPKLKLKKLRIMTKSIQY